MFTYAILIHMYLRPGLPFTTKNIPSKSTEASPDQNPPTSLRHCSELCLTATDSIGLLDPNSFPKKKKQRLIELQIKQCH